MDKVLVVSSEAKSKTLASKIKKGEPILLLYHANWCPHCVDYVGHPRLPSYPWQQVCSYIHTAFGGEVCCSEVESDYISLLPAGMPQVQGFPTLMFIMGDYKEEFSGDRRDKIAIKEFIQKNTKGRKTKSAPAAAAAAKKKVRPATAGGSATKKKQQKK